MARDRVTERYVCDSNISASQIQKRIPEVVLLMFGNKIEIVFEFVLMT